MSALEQILRLVDIDDPFRNAPDDLLALQLEAARERVAQRREQISVLNRRAADTGIAEIRHPRDLVPLLFADANYKSYPESFMQKGRWDKMSQWLQTLSTYPITGMNYTGVKSVDDWVSELRRNGHGVMSSSGTSGKSSFLNQSNRDREHAWSLLLQIMRCSIGNFKNKSRRYPVFLMLPSGGSYTATERMSKLADSIALPGEVHWMSNVPQSAAEAMMMGRIRRAMADGTALPSEISDFEANTRTRQTLIQRDLAEFLDKLISRRKEPMVISGMMTMLYAVVAAARERGVSDGEFHPDTVITIGGGKKGSNLPSDAMAQCVRFFNLTPRNFMDGYGMAEMSGSCPPLQVSPGWALPPWIVPLVLDKKGEMLLNPENGKGTAEGRLGFLDLLVDGRWGGLISGDKVTIDFSARDGGIKVPAIREMVRYKDLPEGDDKLSCAGTIDAYVRGAAAFDA